VKNLEKRLKGRKDPWADFDKSRRKVTKAMLESVGGGE
jgi:DNA primase